MTTIRLESLDDLDDSLSAVEATNSHIPFRTNAWLSAWARHYLNEKNDLYSLAVYEKSKLIGVAPLFRSQSIAYGRVLQFLGDGKVCTDYLSFMALDGYENRVCESLAEFLTDNHTEWDKITLDGVESNDQMVDEFCRAMARRGNSLTTSSGSQCWRLPLPDTWEDYTAMLSKSHRKHVKKVQKRLTCHPDFQVDVARDSKSLAAGMQILIDLHQRRWNSLGEDGCFASPAFEEFLIDAANQLLKQEMLQLIWISFEREPIAIDFNLVTSNGVFAYQSGMSPDHLHLQPGRAMNIISIKNAVESGKTFFDFLRGDEDYKAHWRATPKTTQECTIVPNRIASRTRQGIFQFGRSLKTLVTQAE